jgi:uncharacterized protein YuzB (UPF0349 family)
MATHLQRAGSEPAAWRLTEALNAKLAELTGLGFDVQWIESSRADLTRLIVEGGDDAIRLDPDPAVDRAWYGAVEIRHGATREDTWVFVRGEVASGETSAHVVSAPDAGKPTPGGG